MEILNPISEKNTDVDNLKKEIGKMIKDFFLSFSQQIVRFVFFVYIKESGTFEQNETQKTEVRTRAQNHSSNENMVHNNPH